MRKTAFRRRLRTYGILMAELRAHLSDERLAQLAEAGARLSNEDAAAEALGVDAAHDEGSRENSDYG
jgi:hypothetical protein